VPERQGSGYVGHHAPNFIEFNDQWSQVLNLLYDQNGSVYMIDWYDKNQCHHNNPEGHDRSNGRIFKIVYGDTKWTPVNLEKLSDEELVKLVPSTNEWMSRHARRVLQERAHMPQTAQRADSFVKPFDSHSALARIAQVREGEELPARLRAMWSLHTMGALNADLLGRLSADKEELIRGWALQLAVEDGARDAWLAGMQQLAREDPSPVVRGFVASALQRVSPEDRWHILMELLTHPEDAADHNLPLMYWYAAEPVVGQDPAKAVALLKQCRIPVVREFIARRLATTSLKTMASK